MPSCCLHAISISCSVALPPSCVSTTTMTIIDCLAQKSLCRICHRLLGPLRLLLASCALSKLSVRVGHASRLARQDTTIHTHDARYLDRGRMDAPIELKVIREHIFKNIDSALDIWRLVIILYLKTYQSAIKLETKLVNYKERNNKMSVGIVNKIQRFF